jgi:deazaflavin-dependent oxidoreductase (nitroreductase family)
MILDDDDRRRDVCDLETIGRTSGLPRVVEIWFAAEGDRLYMLSGGRADANWVRNLQRTPRVRVRLGERWVDGTATVIEGRADDQRARELLAAKYQGWRPGRRLTRWARESLPVAIDVSE